MDHPKSPDEDELAHFLDEFWEAFASAESSGDFTEVASLCADNLVFQSPAEEPYETLESLVEAWWTPPPDYTITFDRAELVASEVLAIQRGVASDRFTANNGNQKGHRYNYLAVFRKGDNGWKLTHFISNMIE